MSFKTLCTPSSSSIDGNNQHKDDCEPDQKIDDEPRQTALRVRQEVGRVKNGPFMRYAIGAWVIQRRRAEIPEFRGEARKEQSSE